MKIIDDNGVDYICGYCKRVARMMLRNIEELGRKEWWIHHDDGTPVCTAKPNKEKKA